MDLSIAVAYPCRAKDELGGAPALISLYHQHLQSLAIRQEAERTRKDSGSFSIRVATLGNLGVKEVQTVSLSELERQAARIYEYAEDCAQCPASSNRKLCGCIGIAHLPIRHAAEQWLADRLRRTKGFARDLFLQAIHDFRYDGTPILALRRRNLLELRQAIAVDLPKNSHDLSEITTDHIFHAILGVGPTIDPIHTALILVCLGILQWDRKPISNLELFGWITSQRTAERIARSEIDLGEPAADPGIRQIQNLFMMFYLAWSLDAPVSVQL